LSKPVLFISTARYAYPLDANTAKKFAAIAPVMRSLTIGFADGVRPRVFHQIGSFYLMPNVGMRTIRYGLVLLVAPIVGLFLAVRHRVAVVVAQSPYEGFAGVLITRGARLFGRRPRLVIESHGDFEESVFLYRRVAAPNVVRRFMQMTARFVLKRADALRCVSAATGAQLARYAPHLPMQQFPGWTDFELFLKAERRVDAATSGIVLYAGALTPLKGIHNLVAAFARIASRIKHARLVLAGKAIDESFEKELRAQINPLGIADRIDFIGHVSQEELARWLERSALFVLPSYSEGLPRVLIEAMAVGVPVIATTVGGPRELIRDDETGFLVAPGDEATLAQRMETVLSNLDLATHVGANARLWAHTRFSTEKYVRGYASLLESAEREGV
jgi:glycosyltransferase involved in cell wall biosynthesis